MYVFKFPFGQIIYFLLQMTLRMRGHKNHDLIFFSKVSLYKIRYHISVEKKSFFSALVLTLRRLSTHVLGIER